MNEFEKIAADFQASFDSAMARLLEAEHAKLKRRAKIASVIAAAGWVVVLILLFPNIGG